MPAPCDKPESRRYSQPFQAKWRTRMAILNFLNFLNLAFPQPGSNRVGRRRWRLQPTGPILPA